MRWHTRRAHSARFGSGDESRRSRSAPFRPPGPALLAVGSRQAAPRAPIEAEPLRPRRPPAAPLMRRLLLVALLLVAAIPPSAATRAAQPRASRLVFAATVAYVDGEPQTQIYSLE